MMKKWIKILGGIIFLLAIIACIIILAIKIHFSVFEVIE